MISRRVFAKALAAVPFVGSALLGMGATKEVHGLVFRGHVTLKSGYVYIGCTFDTCVIYGERFHVQGGRLIDCTFRGSHCIIEGCHCETRRTERVKFQTPAMLWTGEDTAIIADCETGEMLSARFLSVDQCRAMREVKG